MVLKQEDVAQIEIVRQRLFKCDAQDARREIETVLLQAKEMAKTNPVYAEEVATALRRVLTSWQREMGMFCILESLSKRDSY